MTDSDQITPRMGFLLHRPSDVFLSRRSITTGQKLSPKVHVFAEYIHKPI